MRQQYANKVFWLIIISMIVKLVAASLLELGNDEVYYWTYSLQPDWNHFDHPPMVGWLIRLTTFNELWVNETTMRLGAILCAAVATWIIFKLGKLLSSEKLGWYAALVYTCSVYTGFIAGFFILPDSPQMLFWTGALYVMAEMFLKNSERKPGRWLLLGLLIGLATLCKVHALFLWVGFGLFLLFTNSKWLFNWRFYMGVLVTAVCISPIVYWNIKNHFITYRYHSERVTHTSIQWDMLGREIGGEFAYQNPVIFLLILVSVIALITRRIWFSFSGNKIRTWLFCMSLPMLLLFWGISLFNPTLPHWAGPAYIPLFLVAALFLEKKARHVYPPFITVAMTLVAIVLVAGIGLIRYSPVNFGSHEKENYGEYCPTLDMSGWQHFSNDFSRLVAEDSSTGKMKAQAPILVDKWFPGGHLEFYTARTTGMTLLGVGSLQDIHKFAWLNKERRWLQLGDDAYCIVPSNLPMNVAAKYGRYFTSIAPPTVINQVRGGKIVRYFYVYRLKSCKQVPPVPL
ncbi:glycosyltransferase family 39 protein [Asinibacterium sp. OR53]|uniref:ArnT family glycosyltransferase n=1 Tax=Asinibacterium sp. OR53 TaxID=925409 RepID=UPI00047C7E7A|nr:glycosyltransferase family 39 protein [Asinibacterium sp. OR53]